MSDSRNDCRRSLKYWLIKTHTLKDIFFRHPDGYLHPPTFFKHLLKLKNQAQWKF